jgi:hypothetical protein
MIFNGIKGISIPEGAVKQIASGGVVLWKASSGADVSALTIGYTGDYTDQSDVVMGDGNTYRLLTLTGSGTLTLGASVKADVWLCAGGNGGRSGGRHGGGGGNFVQSNGAELAITTVCTIGAGAEGTSTSAGGVSGATTFGSLEAVQTTGNYASTEGASGGGAGARGTSSLYTPGAGCGVSTVPFMDTTLFEAHSAGGGGGGYRNVEADENNSGGAGGSNGAGGGTRSSSGYDGGVAGTKGGGTGGKGTSSASTNSGGNATFYGSGGGGGGYYVSSSGSSKTGTGGAGYQGVVYIRIPYEQ